MEYKKNILLAVDIGNTCISFGTFLNGKLTKRFSINTPLYNKNTLKTKIRTLKPDRIIICSVVPKVLRAIRKDIVKLTGTKPFVTGENAIIPIRNLYRCPKQVGQDRLINAFGAGIIYGAPLIVIDFGTAITFDIISKQKAYLGGMIIPGLKISLDALFERTALLPKINLGRPKDFIGKDTKDSMLSGIINGFSALVDELTNKIKREIGGKTIVVGTGGQIKIIADFCKNIDIIDPELTLKSINLLSKTLDE